MPHEQSHTQAHLLPTRPSIKYRSRQTLLSQSNHSTSRQREQHVTEYRTIKQPIQLPRRDVARELSVLCCRNEYPNARRAPEFPRITQSGMNCGERVGKWLAHRMALVRHRRKRGECGYCKRVRPEVISWYRTSRGHFGAQTRVYYLCSTARVCEAHRI